MLAAVQLLPSQPSLHPSQRLHFAARAAERTPREISRPADRPLAPGSPSAVRSRHCLLFDATFLSSARQRRLPAFSTSLVFTSPPPTASHLSSPSLEVTPPRSCL